MDADGGTTSESAATEVVNQVAAAEGVDPYDLPPLYDSIDPGALDRLVASMDESESNEPQTVVFDYAGHRISVSAAGDVSVTPR